MDKKKLIGTIIGVTLFAALIAGATFAWLTFNVAVSDGTYNSTTMNFIITYNKGTDIVDSESDEGIPILTSPTAADARGLSVSAHRTTSTANGVLEIKMTSTSQNDLTSSGALKYSVCSGTASANSCGSNLTTADGTNVLATGSVQGSLTEAVTQTLYTVNSIPTEETHYWILFWLDAEEVTNDHIGDQYSGYIHASATQY